MRTGRVRTRAQFTALRTRGVRARRGTLRMTWLPAPDAASGAGGAGAPVVAVAFAIGKPVGTAVVRNRIRRRLKAALAELAPPPGDYLIAAGPDAAQASYQGLRSDLASCLTDVAASA